MTEALRVAAITTALDHRSPTTRAVRDYWNEDVR